MSTYGTAGLEEHGADGAVDHAGDAGGHGVAGQVFDDGEVDGAPSRSMPTCSAMN
jgi:hypothetical protein